jgi:hypothetical protein
MAAPAPDPGNMGDLPGDDGNDPGGNKRVDTSKSSSDFANKRKARQIVDLTVDEAEEAPREAATAPGTASHSSQARGSHNGPGALPPRTHSPDDTTRFYAALLQNDTPPALRREINTSRGTESTRGRAQGRASAAQTSSRRHTSAPGRLSPERRDQTISRRCSGNTRAQAHAPLRLQPPQLLPMTANNIGPNLNQAPPSFNTVPQHQPPYLPQPLIGSMWQQQRPSLQTPSVHPIANPFMSSPHPLTPILNNTPQQQYLPQTPNLPRGESLAHDEVLGMHWTFPNHPARCAAYIALANHQQQVILAHLRERSADNCTV